MCLAAKYDLQVAACKNCRRLGPKETAYLYVKGTETLLAACVAVLGVPRTCTRFRRPAEDAPATEVIQAPVLHDKKASPITSSIFKSEHNRHLCHNQSDSSADNR